MSYQKKQIQQLNSEEEKRAESVYKKAIVISGLLLGPTLLDLKQVEELKATGITVGHFTCVKSEDDTKDVLPDISFWLKLEQKNAVKIIRTANDIVEAKKKEDLGIILGTQNSTLLGNDVNLVTIFHQLGMRIIMISYLQQNYLGSAGEDKDAGLTNLGREMVEEMNRVGILIDIAHSGDNTVMDTIKYSQKPVVMTHANPRALVDHLRNKTDEQIVALAEKGGIIGITSFTPLTAQKQGVRPTIEDYLDMIDYVVELVGSDHVGIGLDETPNWDYDRSTYEAFIKAYPITASWFTYEEKNAEGCENSSKIINIAKGLVGRGYSDEDIMKILGGNFLELFRKVW